MKDSMMGMQRAQPQVKAPGVRRRSMENDGFSHQFEAIKPAGPKIPHRFLQWTTQGWRGLAHMATAAMALQSDGKRTTAGQ
jgi:hypothetical protein